MNYRMLVVLDAGHGGRDPGTSYGSLKEKHIALKLVQYVQESLTSGYEADVYLTRSSDVYVGLYDRARQANEREADLFVSIHVNAGGGEGLESYIYSGTVNQKTPEYQSIIHEHVMDVLKQYEVQNRGLKEANLAVLRETAMPAVLLEVLFIDNTKDRELLQSDRFLRNVADGIAVGIGDALHLPEKKRSNSGDNEATTELYRVQVGAFGSKENAEELGARLSEAGFESFIYEEDGMFKVQSGAFEKYENAQERAKALQEAGFETFIHT